MRRHQLDRARDAIAQRNVTAITYRRRPYEIGGDDRHNANAEYVITSLDPDCGWAAALTALEDEREQGKITRELLDRAVGLARRILTRIEELGIDLDSASALDLQVIDDARPCAEEGTQLPRGSRAR